MAVTMDQAGSPMPEVHLGSPEAVGPMVEVELPAVVADLPVVAAVLEAQVAAVLEAQGPQEEIPEDTVQAALVHQVDSHRGVGGPEGELDPRARLETPLVLEASRRTPVSHRFNRGPRTGRSRVAS